MCRSTPEDGWAWSPRKLSHNRHARYTSLLKRIGRRWTVASSLGTSAHCAGCQGYAAAFHRRGSAPDLATGATRSRYSQFA